MHIHQGHDCGRAAPLDKGMGSSWYPERAIGKLLASCMHLCGTWLFQCGKETSSAAAPQWVMEALSLCLLWENELEMLVWDEPWTELGLEPWMPVSLLLPVSGTCCPSRCACLWHNVVMWCCFGTRPEKPTTEVCHFDCFPLERKVILFICMSWMFVYHLV